MGSSGQQGGRFLSFAALCRFDRRGWWWAAAWRGWCSTRPASLFQRARMWAQVGAGHKGEAAVCVCWVVKWGCNTAVALAGDDKEGGWALGSTARAAFALGAQKLCHCLTDPVLQCWSWWGIKTRATAPRRSATTWWRMRSSRWDCYWLLAPSCLQSVGC